MKYFFVLALVAAASAATVPHARFAEESDESARLFNLIQNIINSILNPVNVGPALVDTPEPIQVGPALVDTPEPIQVGPALVDTPEPIQVGPALVDTPEPIQVGPAIVDPVEEISVGPAFVDPAVPPFNPFALNGPLVQVVVNVDSASSDSVSIEQPALKPVPGGDYQQIKPDPVIVIDNPEPAVIEPEPVQIAKPVFPDPAANLPDVLN